MFQWLKDLLKILTWKEYWIAVSVPTAIVGFWLMYCLLVSIPIAIIRATAIWISIFIISLLSATVRMLRKKSERSS